MEFASSEIQHILSRESSWDIAGWMLVGASVSGIILIALVITLFAMMNRKK